MSVMEAMEVSQACDITRLQRENEELRRTLDETGKMLDESTAMRKRTEARLADAEEKCQELSEKLVVAEDKERWAHRKIEMLSAQMEVVNLIFGGNRQGRDCGGCH